MSDILSVFSEVLEGTDAWNVGAIAVPRAGFATPVLLTQSDISGLITLNVFPWASSTPVYTTTFSKSLVQAGGTEAIHPALVDGRWGINTIGHNFVHLIRQSDVGAGVLKGGRTYRFTYLIPTSDIGTVPAIFDWRIKPLH